MISKYTPLQFYVSVSNILIAKIHHDRHTSTYSTEESCSSANRIFSVSKRYAPDIYARSISVSYLYDVTFA